MHNKPTATQQFIPPAVSCTASTAQLVLRSPSQLQLGEAFCLGSRINTAVAAFDNLMVLCFVALGGVDSD